MSNNSNDFEAQIEDFEDQSKSAAPLAPSNGGGTASTPPPPAGGRKFKLEDFFSVAPLHKCVYRPGRDIWPNAAVDLRLPRIPRLDARGQLLRHKKTGEILTEGASAWLARQRSVERVVWLPGADEIIRDKIAGESGWIPKVGATNYNLYLPPNDIPGDATKAGRWIEHVRRLFPDEADHIIAWKAHRIQRPGIKPNFGILLIGPPGIGKDTILIPLREGVGPWNYKDIKLNQLATTPFNDYLCAVVLRINEVRDAGDVGKSKIDRYSLHDHMKPLLASPPETFRINRKNMQEFAGFNIVGVVITSNHQDALYLPEDDRRLLVANSPCKTGEFSPEFFTDFYHWYEKEGGIGHVIAYLKSYDLSEFNAYAAPPKTAGFWNIVAADRGPEHGELLDAIDALGKPEALTVTDLISKAPSAEWLLDRKQSRAIPHHLRRCGYERTPNPNNERSSGMWRDDGKRTMIYARAELGRAERLAAAQRRCDHGPAHARKANVTVVSDNTGNESTS
jgi:hypothetical protein